MFIIKLYLDNGEKVSLDYSTESQAVKVVRQMEKKNEVFSVGRVEADGSITEISL